jgi:altronate dehydratase
MGKVIRIHEKDNVIIALEPLSAGTEVTDSVVGSFQLGSAVPAFHKIATVDIEKDAPVYKYGTSIGVATEFIQKGVHVHVHNLDFIEMS